MGQKPLKFTRFCSRLEALSSALLTLSRYSVCLCVYVRVCACVHLLGRHFWLNCLHQILHTYTFPLHIISKGQKLWYDHQLLVRLYHLQM